MKKNTKYIIILSAVLFFLVIIEYFAPKPLDWKATFSKNDKIPYGSYIINDLIKEAHSQGEPIDNTRTIYLSFDSIETANYNFVCITSDFKPDNVEINTLLDFVDMGNNAFIAADRFHWKFLDSLQIKTDFQWKPKTDTVIADFVNPNIKKNRPYFIDKLNSSNHFSKIDTAKTTVLGIHDGSFVDFIKIQHGKGAFFLSTQPYFFTNYAIMNGNMYDYVNRAFSYLPLRKIIWDEYYKPFNKQASSPLRYILNEEALRYAYYIFLIGILIYILFEMKRRQRIIPIIKPLTNTSLEFISTIGRLYLHSKNHKELMQKKYKYFREYLRAKYYINLSEKELPDFEKVSEKTGVNLMLVKRVFYNFKTLNKQRNVSTEDLIKINSLIDRFYKECK